MALTPTYLPKDVFPKPDFRVFLAGFIMWDFKSRNGYWYLICGVGQCVVPAVRKGLLRKVKLQ